MIVEAGFEEKFVAFIDLLGFKGMVEAAERGERRTVPEIFELMDILGNEKGSGAIHKDGPKICPMSPRVREDLAFEVTQVSDCAIVSAEISPAGVIALVNHCWSAVIMLMTKGVLVRGYITRGNIIHRDGRLLGSGYQDAYARETGIVAFRMEADEKGTPFVEVDPVVTSYVAGQSDGCVKEMFSRMVESDGSVTALYPFKRLTHSFSIGGIDRPAFDPEKEKRSNDNLRKSIRKLIDKVTAGVDPSNAAALGKTRHYIAALEKQIDVCDQTDEMIDRLSQPIGRRS
jgi:hypothetical protein